MKNVIEFCRDHNACSPAVSWLKAGKFKSLQQAWDACPCGTWMMWWLERTLPVPQHGGDLHRRLVRVAVESGRLSLPYAGGGRPQLEKIYSALVRWCNGDNNVDLQAAADSAWAAINSAEAAYYSAVATAYSAWAAAASARAAADSVVAAAASAVAAAASARAAAEKEIADIVRKYFPKPEAKWAYNLI